MSGTMLTSRRVFFELFCKVWWIYPASQVGYALFKGHFSG